MLFQGVLGIHQRRALALALTSLPRFGSSSAAVLETNVPSVAFAFACACTCTWRVVEMNDPSHGQRGEARTAESRKRAKGRDRDGRRQVKRRNRSRKRRGGAEERISQGGRILGDAGFGRHLVK